MAYKILVSPRALKEIEVEALPFALYFIINEEKNIVKVLSCFHVKRNPVIAQGYNVVVSQTAAFNINPLNH